MNCSTEHGFDSLVVGLITPSEIARFNELLDEHHYLRHNLVGRVLRYVAGEDDEWVALVGFGSPSLSLRAREDFIGWSEQAKSRRLRFVVNNQRFCVLPGRRRENLASAVLGRTLKRVSQGAEAVYGDPVLLIETFTDPARHAGTCYKAANFVLVGKTSGYGRRNGSWVRHDVAKLAWVYPLQKRARAILAAPFDHPMLQGALKRRKNVTGLNTVVIDGQGGLYARLCTLADHRKPKGVRQEADRLRGARYDRGGRPGHRLAGRRVEQLPVVDRGQQPAPVDVGVEDLGEGFRLGPAADGPADHERLAFLWRPV